MTKRTVTEIRMIFAGCHGAALAERIAEYADDTRPGVVAVCKSAQTRLEHEAAEQARLERLAILEDDLWERGFEVVAGVDEVGRGALAGPVTAAACVLPRDALLVGLNDSKKLTAVARRRLNEAICETAIAVEIAHVSPAVIDRMGIGRATVRAMREALDALAVSPGHVIVDGLPVDLGRLSTAVIRADSTVRVVAAASIVAKVARDRLMVDLDTEYPGYKLAANKGYGSREHLEAIVRLGPSEIHRRSFAPCNQGVLFQ